MKRLNGAWLAYWILFLVFEVSIVAYIQRYDRFDQMRIINNWHVLPVDNLFRGLSFLGELLVPIGLLLYFIFKKKAWVKPFLFSYVASTLLVQGIKHLVFPNALRPYSYFKALDIPWYLVKGIEMNEYHSFPSGHTAAAWFCFIWVALVLKKPWVGGIAALLAVGVALSRVYLFQHFPVDVAFGALIGISCSSIFYYLYHETLAK